MDKGTFLVWCLGFAGVLGLSWGLLLSFVDVDLGVVVGVVLFVFGFKVIYRPDAEEETVPLRRFND